MISRATRAKLVTTAGAAGAVSGVYGYAGWPAAAVAGGVYVLGFGILFMETDDPQPDQQQRRRRLIERGSG